jgi:hypothetical protein
MTKQAVLPSVMRIGWLLAALKMRLKPATISPVPALEERADGRSSSTQASYRAQRRPESGARTSPSATCPQTTP